MPTTVWLTSEKFGGWREQLHQSMEGQRHATSGEGQTTGNAGTKSGIDGKRQDGWCLEYQFTSLVFRQPGLTTCPLERT